jgi:hypothetical protein
VDSLEPYLIGQPTLPDLSEQSWKDTIIVFSQQITVIRIRFAQQDGKDFPFDATTGPGYVWHCHILEHEDNEMMRPYIITTTAASATSQQLIITIIALVVIIVGASIGLRKYRSRSIQKP